MAGKKAHTASSSAHTKWPGKELQLRINLYYVKNRSGEGAREAETDR